MLTFGHIAFSYLLLVITIKNYTFKELLFIFICGNILDIDFIILTLLGYPGGTHHNYPGHSLLALIFYLSIFILLFRKIFKLKIFILGTIATLMHLFLDNLSHFLSLLNLEKFYVPSQIMWFYPFNFQSSTNLEFINQQTNQQILDFYLQSYTFIIEIFIIIIALLVFIYRRLIYKKA